eukprot:SAG11_NODE_32686_length_281_cov_1.456044_1_plen_36_part_10
MGNQYLGTATMYRYLDDGFKCVTHCTRYNFTGGKST